MKYFSQYLKEAGNDPTLAVPELVPEYFAYKEGKVFGPFSKQTEALAFSKNVDKVYTEASVKARDEYWKNQRKIEAAAQDAWYADLREEYAVCSYFGWLTPAAFAVVYNQAYEKSHHAGYDEVASTFEELVDFAAAIIEAYEGLK